MGAQPPPVATPGKLFFLPAPRSYIPNLDLQNWGEIDNAYFEIGLSSVPWQNGRILHSQSPMHYSD
jgi:hypothetical protein